MEYFSTKNGSLFCSDNISHMKKMEDDCVDLIITSPPYDDLRKYNGFKFDFENTAKELYRITKDGGVVVWIVGDSTKKGSETGTSFNQALFFKKCGFNLHDTMIYHRLAMPNSAKRYNQDFEYMFVLVKGKINKFNPITVDCKYAGQTTSPTSRNNKGELISKGKRVIKDKKKKSNIWFYTAGINKSTKDKVAFKHPAIFPEQLAYDHIVSWSNEGDLVYDPFMGSGTVAKMCEKLNRNWIGTELSEEYCKIIKERIEDFIK